MLETYCVVVTLAFIAAALVAFCLSEEMKRLKSTQAAAVGELNALKEQLTARKPRPAPKPPASETAQLEPPDPALLAHTIAGAMNPTSRPVCLHVGGTGDSVTLRPAPGVYDSDVVIVDDRDPLPGEEIDEDRRRRGQTAVGYTVMSAEETERRIAAYEKHCKDVTAGASVYLGRVAAAAMAEAGNNPANDLAQITAAGQRAVKDELKECAGKTVPQSFPVG